jgi:hypothetical protein
MNKAMIILLASILSNASLAAPDTTNAPPVHDLHHAHHSAQDTTTTPPNGQLWPTDEPLRVGMSRIEAAVAQATDQHPLSRERARDLADTIESNVAYIVEHCNLPAEPDAALHVLIGRMMSAATQLKEDAASLSAIAQLRSALHDYRATFNHDAARSSHRPSNAADGVSPK